jgi:predicted dehydrogenase
MERDLTLRVGIAGAGAFAAFLAEALAPLPQFQLTAVASRTPAKRQRVIDTYRACRPGDPVPVEYASAESLIDEAELDVVIVATPPDTQAELTGRALSRGRHVFLEKPGALSSEALAVQVHAAAAKHRAIVVDLVMRHNPLIEAVAQVLRHALIGRPEHASLVNAAHRVIGNGHWFWDPARSGGILVEHGVHFFEVGRYWFGEAKAQSGGSVAEESGEHSRVFATVWHAADDCRTVPVTYYHGFTRAPWIPEITRWEVICEAGRIILEGWIPQMLRIEADVDEAAARGLDHILDHVPQDPDVHAVAQVRRASAELSGSAAGHVQDKTGTAAASSTRRYERTVYLPDRQGWYKAMVQARFLDLCAMCLDPNYAGLITPQDAVRDLAIAQACSADLRLQD